MPLKQVLRGQTKPIMPRWIASAPKRSPKTWLQGAEEDERNANLRLVSHKSELRELNMLHFYVIYQGQLWIQACKSANASRCPWSTWFQDLVSLLRREARLPPPSEKSARVHSPADTLSTRLKDIYN